MMCLVFVYKMPRISAGHFMLLAFHSTCRISFDRDTRANFIEIISNYFIASSTATATATVIPTMGLLPAPISPIIST